MKFLLDTQVFLWFVLDDQRLSSEASDVIRSREHSIFLSVVSLWEVITKHQIGKMPLPAPPAQYLPHQREKHGLESMALVEAAALEVLNLPLIHRDPFDRMLLAQARHHDLTLLTADEMLQKYDVPIMDARR